LLLGGAGVLGEAEVPVEVEVPVGVEVPLEADVPAPLLGIELALGSELPEHAFNRRMQDRRVNRTAH
jgi:hypothetical protein